MEIYTFPEIQHDVQEFEGCQMKFTLKRATVFVKKYFEHYLTRLGGDCTVRELQERFAEFMSACARPQCDISPAELRDFGVYAMQDPMQPAQLFCQFTNDNYDFFRAKDLPANTTCWFVINSDYDVLEYFERPQSA